MLKNLVYRFAVGRDGSTKVCLKEAFEEYQEFARSGKPRCLRGIDRWRSWTEEKPRA